MRPIAAAAALALALAGAGCRGPDPCEVRAGIERRAAGGDGRAALVRDLPFIETGEADDCGAAALATVLAAAGEPRDPAEVRRAIFEPARGGAPTSALVRYARAQGVFALVRERWTLDDLKAWIRAGVAPIALVAAGRAFPGRYHYVLLEGYDDEARVLLVQDQKDPDAAIPYDEFFPRWCEARGFALVVCSPGIRLPPGEAGLDAHELGALGWLAEKRGDLESARRHYEAALARDPGFRAAAHNLGNVERALARRRAE